jgi:hypothetical protein
MAKKPPPSPDATPPGKPRGQSLRWSAADIERLATVGPQDVAAAHAEFRRHAPKRFKGLLQAKRTAKEKL